MLRKAINLVKTQTAKDASAMTIGTGIGALVAAVFFILTARFLGPENFGVFSLATAASFMFADIFDIAINASLVRFVAAERRKENGEEEQFLKFILKLKLAIGIVLILVVSLFANSLSKLLFGRSLPNVLLLTGLGTGFQLVFTFAVTHLQARSEFTKAAGGMVVLPTLRLFGLLALVLAKALATISILLVYFFATPFAAIALMFLSPRGFLRAQSEAKIAKRFFRYNLPLTLGFALAAVAGRIDNFILANLSGPVAVGFYAAAFRLFTPAQLLAGSLSTVFAPRLAGFERHDQAKTYFGKAVVAIALLSLGLLLLLPFSSFIINLFYGADYYPSVAVLRILLVGFALFLLQAPFTSFILYYLAKPRVFSIISAIQLLTLVIADLLLIPGLAEKGAALAFLITQLVVLAVFAIYSLKKLSK